MQPRKIRDTHPAEEVRRWFDEADTDGNGTLGLVRKRAHRLEYTGSHQPNQSLSNLWTIQARRSDIPSDRPLLSLSRVSTTESLHVRRRESSTCARKGGKGMLRSDGCSGWVRKGWDAVGEGERGVHPMVRALLEAHATSPGHER